MRKSKVWQIMAAAVAATPATLAFAEDVGAPAGEVRDIVRPVAPNDFILGAGKFRFDVPVPGGGGPDANVDGTFLGGVFSPGDGVSWQNPANWTTSPQIPDGTTAIARFTGQSNGASVTLGGTTVSVSRLDMNDPQLTSLGGGTLVLTGSGIVEANGTFFNPTGVIFSGINNLGTATTSLTLAGSAGLTKQGDSPVQIGQASTFTGPVNVNGGQLIIAGGDESLGNAANTVTLNNGTMDVRTANWVTSRTINIGAGGGSVFYAGAGRTFVSSGDITGSGTLRINGGFGAPDAATFNTAKSFTGALRVDAGTLNIDGPGAVANAASVRSSGTLILRGTGVNKIGDATPVTLDGGVFVANNVGTEAMGNLTLEQSTSWVQMFPGGGSTLQFAGVTRNNKATAAFRGENLGSAVGGASQVRFTAAPALVGGIIPWAYGNAANQSFSTPESEDNTLVTYGANGVTPVTSYVDLASSNASTNALVSDAGATVNGSVSANALVLRTSVGYSGTPMTVGGTGTINLTTGVILSANAGFQPDGVTINSTPGNVIAANVNGGANEIIIHAPSAISFNGVISGSGGLTKSGGRTAFFNNDNTYTGETNLTGFVRFNRNVANGAPSPFGNSTTAVNLYSGNFSPINQGTGAANGAMAGILAADNNSGAVTFARPLNVKGSGGGLLRNFSNGPLTMTGAINIDAGSQLTAQMFGIGGTGSDQMILAAPVSGAGKLVIRDVASGGATPGAFVRLVTANPGLTGGVDVGGSVQVENNGAFGTGSITMSNTVRFSSTTGARNVSNPLFVVAGSLSFDGTNPFEWSGPITAVGGDIVNLTSTNTSTVTLSGNIVNAGGFWKTGPGTVVVSGNNTFNGLINVGNGTTEGGMVVLASNNAAGTNVGHIGVNSGQNALAIQGNVNVGDELVFLRGNGIGDLGALRNLSGTNTMAGRVQAGVANTIGVDAGQLNVGRSWFSIGSGTEAGTAVARKVGAGVLQIGSEQFTATRSGGATSSFQGSVIADRLDIAQGVVRIQASSGATRRVADVGSVSLGAGAQLDLTNNALVVDYASDGASPLADIRAKIVSGYAGGAWNGPGITTSQGNTSNFGLGYAEGTAVLTYAGTPADALFLGDVVDQSAVLVRHTRYGDANLDGLVNLADFNRLAAGFGSGTRWDQGDFDYNGIVNLSDFNRLAANFGQAAAGTEVTPEDWANLASAIPEPSSLALAAVGAAAMLRRRRRA